MSRRDRSGDRPARRILLLAGQAFALGLTTAWVMIPASAIFLDAYGSDLLAVTYIGAGLAGWASSAALAASFRRRSPAEVATRVLAGTSVSLLVAWALLWSLDAVWVSFALLVVVPILVPTGFVFIVGQAGSLLDVRALKASYARVVAGFALGFVTGGLGGPRLLAALGSTEHLLAAAAGASALFLALVVVTRRTYPGELAAPEPDDGVARPTVRDLLRDRYVALIVAFQVLSAIESQWLDFLVLDRAAERYHDSEELARFVSRFTAIAYGADIVFLLVLAGFLLRRFGLRYGLTANSAAVLTVLSAVIAASASQGSGATVVFVLVVAARVTDLVCSDGTSRTSLSAAYQVVPARRRLSAQALVEGLAVPSAIAVSGAVLLVLGASFGTGGLLLPVLTAVVVTAWVVVALALYHAYRVNLLERLRHRELRPADLVIDGGRDLEVVAGLLQSTEQRDVWLGLDALGKSSHPSLAGHLSRLATDDRAPVRAAAIERLLPVNEVAAAEAARAGLGDASPGVRAAAARVLGACGGSGDLRAVAAHASDPSADVRVAAAAAMTRLGDDAVRAQVSADVGRLSRSPDVDERILAARLLEACEPGSLVDRAPLAALVRDRAHDVVLAALEAVRWPADAAVLDTVAERLTERSTAAAAVATLVGGGPVVLGLADDGLASVTADPRTQESWAKVCRATGGPDAAAVLLRHVEHPDRDVGLAVLVALGSLEQVGVAGGERFRESAVVRRDLEHAARLLHAIVSFEREPDAGVLRSALGDELGLVRRRVLAALAIGYGTEGVRMVEFQLAQEDPRAHALALEWLEVTLVGTDRAAVALLEPVRSPTQRLSALSRWYPREAAGPAALLTDLVEDPERRWRRPWLSACALHVAWRQAADALDHGWLDSLPDPAVDGSGADIFDETLAAIARRRALDPI